MATLNPANAAYADEFGRIAVRHMDSDAQRSAAARRESELLDEACVGFDPEKRYAEGLGLDFQKVLDAVGGAGVYAAGCPMNDAREGLAALAYELAGGSASRRAEVDERIARRDAGLRAEAGAGLDPSRSYATDPRWAVELRVMADSYARGGFDGSEEGLELRDILAKACDAYATGAMVVPEGLMRRYVRLTFDSWLAL